MCGFFLHIFFFIKSVLKNFIFLQAYYRVDKKFYV